MKKMILFCAATVYLTLLFTSLPTFADVKKDRKAKADLAMHYYEKGTAYKDKLPDSAIYYGEQQLALAQSLNDHNLIAKAYYILGYAYAQKKVFDVSALHYYKGLDAVKGKEDKYSDYRRKDISSGLGYVYEQTYNYDLALQFHSTALEISKKYNHTRHVGILNYYVGIIYKKMDQLDMASEYYFNAANILSDVDDKYNLAKTYNSIGNLFLHQKQYDKATEYYFKALAIVDNLPSLQNEKAIYLSNLGENHYKQKNYSKAQDQYLAALQVSKELRDYERASWINNNLGDVYLTIQDYQTAIEYYDQGIELAQQHAVEEELRRGYKNSAEAYAAMGMYKISSDYKSKYIEHIDEIEAIKENLTQQNAQYRMKEVEWQLEKQSQQVKIARVETENLWVKIIVGLALIVIVIGSRIIYTYYRKIAKAREVLELPYVELDEY